GRSDRRSSGTTSQTAAADVMIVRMSHSVMVKVLSREVLPLNRANSLRAGKITGNLWICTGSGRRRHYFHLHFHELAGKLSDEPEQGTHSPEHGITANSPFNRTQKPPYNRRHSK